MNAMHSTLRTCFLMIYEFVALHAVALWSWCSTRHFIAQCYRCSEPALAAAVTIDLHLVVIVTLAATLQFSAAAHR